MTSRAVGAAAMGLVALACGPDSTEPERGGSPFTLESWYTVPARSASDFPTRLRFRGDGELWVTTSEGLVVRVKDGAGTTVTLESIGGAGTLRDLFVDERDRVWLAAGASVWLYADDTWTEVSPPDYMGLSPLAYRVAVNAREDVLIAVGDATSGGLLLRHDGVWRALTPSNSALPSPLVRSIAVDADGAFWVAAAQWQGRGGVSRVDPDGVTHVFDRSDGLLYDWIDAATFVGPLLHLGYAVPIYDRLGLPDGGIQALSPHTGVAGTWFPYASGLASNRVMALAAAPGGALWFTTGLDADDQGCRTCVPAVGMLDASGSFSVTSSVNSELPLDEYLPDVDVGPDGGVYVLRAVARDVARVVR